MIHTVLLPQLFRGTETLLGKRGRPDEPLGVLLRKKITRRQREDATRRLQFLVSELASYTQIECPIELNWAQLVVRKAA